MGGILKALVFFMVMVLPTLGWAQKKLDLDDVSIKGELHNDDRLRISARERNNLKNYIKFRSNYRQEISEGLPTPVPQVKY